MDKIFDQAESPLRSRGEDGTDRLNLLAISDRLTEQPDGRPSVEITLASSQDFERLHRYSRKTELHVKTVGATDDDLKTLSGMENIVSLDLTGSEVTDKGAAHLSGLFGLKELNVAFTDITNTGLSEFRSLTNLKSLNLTGLDIDRTGLAQLSSLPALTHLELSGTAEVVGVVKLPNIQELVVQGHPPQNIPNTLDSRTINVQDKYPLYKYLAYLKYASKLKTLAMYDAGDSADTLALYLSQEVHNVIITANFVGSWDKKDHTTKAQNGDWIDFSVK